MWQRDSPALYVCDVVSPVFLAAFLIERMEIDMSVVELLRWQYAGYAKFHQSRANLLLHIVVVPLFILGSVVLIVSLMKLTWLPALIAIALMVASMALQGRGHGREQLPPEPFTGAANVISRIILEQWVTFPRFVISGGWLRALRLSDRAESSRTEANL